MMKNKKVLISAALLLIVVIVCISVFVSCNGKETLAENLEGTWTCPPTQIESGKDANVVCVRTFVVTRTPDKLGGEVQFSGLVNVTSSLTSEQGFLQATTFSASGTIKAKGTWLVKDDDEITVTYDPASVVADFPAETILLPNAPFSASDSIAATYKNAIAQSVSDRMKIIFMTKASELLEVEDIEMDKDNQSFVCEVHDKKYVIRKQAAN